MLMILSKVVALATTNFIVKLYLINIEIKLSYVGNLHKLLDFWDTKRKRKNIIHTEAFIQHKKLCGSVIRLYLQSCSDFTIFRKIIQSVAVQFSLLNNTQNPNMKQQYLYPTQRIHNGLKKRAKKFSPRSPLHRLNLRKSLIKNFNTFISDQIIIQIKHKLVST